MPQKNYGALVDINFYRTKEEKYTPLFMVAIR